MIYNLTLVVWMSSIFNDAIFFIRYKYFDLRFLPSEYSCILIYNYAWPYCVIGSNDVPLYNAYKGLNMASYCILLRLICLSPQRVFLYLYWSFYYYSLRSSGRVKRLSSSFGYYYCYILFCCIFYRWCCYVPYYILVMPLLLLAPLLLFS